MLKPYLDSKSSDATTNSQVVTDEDRIKSIKQHFDTLTAITAQDLAAEAASKNVVESSDDDDNLEETTIDDYDPDPGDVKKLREAKESSWKYKKDQKKAAKKRKEGIMQQGQNESAKKEKIDMENVDFSQYSSGVGRNVKTFDPMKEFRDGAGKKKNYGKPKHRPNNKSGKTMTYKKK